MTATAVTPDSASSSTSNRRATARGAAWSTMAFTVIGVGQLLVLSTLKHRLTEADFGIVTATLVVIGFGKIFTTSGVGPAIVQRDRLERRHITTGFSVSVLTGVAALLVLGLGASAIASIFHADELIPLLRLLAVGFLVQSFGIVAEGILQRDFRFKALAICEIVSFGLGFIVVGLVLAARGSGIWTMAIANLVQAVLKVVMVLAATRHPVSWRIDRDAGRDLAKFASGFTLAKIFNYAGVNGDNIVIGNRMTPADLGNYGFAYNLLAMPAMFFGQIVDRVLFPIMARMQDDKARLAETYRRGVASIATVTGPGGALILVLAPELVRLFGGTDSAKAINPLRAFALGLTLRTGYKISDSLARSSGTVFKRAKRQAVYAVLVVAGAYIGHFWGLTAAAIGVLFALLANYLLMADLSLRTTGLTWGSFASAHWRGAVLGVLTGVVGTAVATPMRSAAVSFWWILFTTILIVGVMFGGLLLVRRDLVLGDIEWLLPGRKPASTATSPTANPVTTDMAPARPSAASRKPSRVTNAAGRTAASKAVAKSAPAKSASAKSAPAKSSAAKSTPAKASAAKSAPGKSAPGKPAPAKPASAGPNQGRAKSTPPGVSAKQVYSATPARPTRPTRAVDPAATTASTPAKPMINDPGLRRSNDRRPSIDRRPQVPEDTVRPAAGPTPRRSAADATPRPPQRKSARVIGAKAADARPPVDYAKVDLLALALKIADTEPAGRRGAKKNPTRNPANPPAADPGASRG